VYEEHTGLSLNLNMKNKLKGLKNPKYHHIRNKKETKKHKRRERQAELKI